MERVDVWGERLKERDIERVYSVSRVFIRDVLVYTCQKRGILVYIADPRIHDIS